MKNVNTTPYIPPELEIIAFECNDIVTASGGYVRDDEVDEEWW